MTYQLPPDIDQRVQSQIALGIYQTPAEVLSEALDALERQHADFRPLCRHRRCRGRSYTIIATSREMRERYGSPGVTYEVKVTDRARRLAISIRVER